MINHKFFSLLPSLLTFSLTGFFGNITPVVAAASNRPSPTQTTLAEDTSLGASQPELLAQFGLGNIIRETLETGTVDVEGHLENNVDQKIQGVESQIRQRIPNVLLPLLPDDLFSLEAKRLSEFATYFNKKTPEFEQTPEDITAILSEVAKTTGRRHALIYLSYTEDNHLEFLLFAPDSPPQTLYVEDVNPKTLSEMVTQFRSDLVVSLKMQHINYLEKSRSLYRTLIAPISGYLQENKIDSLIFSLDEGLRTLPLAALHDGDRFLIEKYNLAIIPSFFDIDSEYTSLKQSPALTMGADDFSKAGLDPLPGAYLEVEAIADITQGYGLVNEEFTVENLKQYRKQQSFPILHLATHAQFNPGKPKESSIYLWQKSLGLDDLDKLDLDAPQLNLMVLSACQTALGDREAELGFAGLTIASGSKTVLGSLWSISDSGTLVLMQHFYHNLKTEMTKAEALRKAQLAMLRGEFQVVNGQIMMTSGDRSNIRLVDNPETFKIEQLAHPFYWSGFTIVGRPW